MFILLEDPDNPDSTYVFHKTAPRFLMEFVPGGEGDFILIDLAHTADEIAMHKSRAREFFEDGQAGPVPRVARAPRVPRKAPRVPSDPA